METDLEGNILHQDEWSMYTTPPVFPPLSVLLRNLFVHGMISLLKDHVPPFIHSCIPLLFELQIQNRLLRSLLKTQGYHPSVIQDTPRPTRPSRTLVNPDNSCCPSALSLDPSSIKGNLGCCIGISAAEDSAGSLHGTNLDRQ